LQRDQLPMLWYLTQYDRPLYTIEKISRVALEQCCGSGVF
jgi:hypothetical protein